MCKSKHFIKGHDSLPLFRIWPLAPYRRRAPDKLLDAVILWVLGFKSFSASESALFSMFWFCLLPVFLIGISLFFYTSTKSWRGYIFTAVCLCVCVCVCVSVCLSVCLCVRHFLWTKFQPNGCTDLNAIFAKWLLSALARTLLNLVTLGQRSRS